jgi:hypothetical protein
MHSVWDAQVEWPGFYSRQGRDIFLGSTSRPELRGSSILLTNESGGGGVFPWEQNGRSVNLPLTS